MASDATRIRVAWGPVPGASGFRISWTTGSGLCGVCGLLRGATGHAEARGRAETSPSFPLIPGPESSQTLTPDSTATDILGLQPGTSYHVAVSALRGREEGAPVVIVAQTGQRPTSLGSLPPVSFQTSLAPLITTATLRPILSTFLLSSLPPSCSPVSLLQLPLFLFLFLLLIPQSQPLPPLWLDPTFLLDLFFVLCLMSSLSPNAPRDSSLSDLAFQIAATSQHPAVPSVQSWLPPL